MDETSVLLTYGQPAQRSTAVVRLLRFAGEDDGQNLVEFALLLPILMYILMGIMQFGLVFAAYITINNTVREAARWGSIYVYDSSTGQGQSTNDTTRQNGMLDRVIVARGILNLPGSAGGSNSNFDTGSSWAAGAVATDCFIQPGAGDTATAVKRGDVTICYTQPSSLTANDSRRGYYMEVTAWYHQQVFIPLLDAFLPDDTTKPSGEQAQWLRLPGRVTVVIN